MIPAADLAALYDAADGLTVSATFGSESAQVHFRQPAVDALGGERQVADYTMRYRTATFTTLARGSTVVIGGVSYKVLERPAELGAGDERLARLSKV